MKECLHVWEFLRDMLKDNRPEIQWIDKTKGIFKIIDAKKVNIFIFKFMIHFNIEFFQYPFKVAKEWGFMKKKSENKVMSYAYDIFYFFILVYL